MFVRVYFLCVCLINGVYCHFDKGSYESNKHKVPLVLKSEKLTSFNLEHYLILLHCSMFLKALAALVWVD